MGYNLNSWFHFNKCLKKAGLLVRDELPEHGALHKDEIYYSKEMLELGCQVFRGHIRKKMNSDNCGHITKNILHLLV